MQKYVAQRIKTLRTEQGISQTELAAMCNVSKSLISKLETNKATMHLDILIQITQALGVSMNDLLEPVPESKKRAMVIKEHDRKKLAGGVPGKAGHSYYRLAGSDVMSAFWLVIGAEALEAPRWVRHEGSEFIYIVDGQAKLQFRDEEYTLKEGDSAFFDSRSDHKIIPLNQESVQIILIFVH